MRQRLLSHHAIFYDFLQRGLYQCKRRPYVMGRINEEPSFLVRHFLLFMQHDETEYGNHNQYQQKSISHHRPHTGPRRGCYDNLNVSCLIGLILLFIGYGTDVESQVYTEFDEQFQALAWLVLILLVVEMLILERKNPLFKNVRLFK